jgi:GT2 family glycosyltransferase
MGGVPAPPHLPEAAVVIATYNRPEHVAECLTRVAAQTVAPRTVIVVDSSDDDRTRAVVDGFPGVRYVTNALGRGHTATSRRIGVELCVGVEVVAFLDDDAYAAPDWLEQLLGRYDEPDVGAVGGRAANGQPGETEEGLGAIGRLLPNGTLTGHFAADPGRDVEVDHLLGANMSLRLSAVEAVGGIEDHYPGTCLREETEIVLRMRAAGYRVLYTPAAFVEHVAGPYAKGRRFDLRYTYYAERNHLVLLARALGVRDPHFRRYLDVQVRTVGNHARYAVRALKRPAFFGDQSKARGVANGVTRAAATVVGGVAGGVAAAGLAVQARAKGGGAR